MHERRTGVSDLVCDNAHAYAAGAAEYAEIAFAVGDIMRHRFCEYGIIAALLRKCSFVIHLKALCPEMVGDRVFEFECAVVTADFYFPLSLLFLSLSVRSAWDARRYMGCSTFCLSALPFMNAS